MLDPLRSMVGVFALTFLFNGIGLADVEAIPSDAEAAQLGLVVHWRGQVERTRTGFGKTGIALWPHSTDRREVVTVKVGGRVIETFDANEIDEQLSRDEVLASARAGRVAKLGLSAARDRANHLAKQFEVIGRQAVVEEFSQPMTYLIAASNDGAFQAFDAETGEVLWNNSIGDARFPTYGPGVNDRFVAGVNGNNLYVLDLRTGKQTGKRALSNGIMTIPKPIGTRIFVSGMNGTLTAYDGEDIMMDPKILRVSGSIKTNVTASPDKHFLAWPHSRYVYIAAFEEEVKLWSRVSTSSEFRSAVQSISDGFIACSGEGMVFRIGFDRLDAIEWKTNLAVPVTSTPLVVGDLVTVISSTGDLFALDLETGVKIWKSPELDIDRVLSITPTRIYAQRRAGQLVAIDRETGRSLATLNKRYAVGFHNDVNDRIILFSETGGLICLREPETIYPMLNTTRASIFKETEEEGKSRKSSNRESETNDSRSPFDSGSFDDDSADRMADPFEGFGGDDDDNPFGF